MDTFLRKNRALFLIYGMPSESETCIDEGELKKMNELENRVGNYMYCPECREYRKVMSIEKQEGYDPKEPFYHLECGHIRRFVAVQDLVNLEDLEGIRTIGMKIWRAFFIEAEPMLNDAEKVKGIINDNSIAFLSAMAGEFAIKALLSYKIIELDLTLEVAKKDKDKIEDIMRRNNLFSHNYYSIVCRLRQLGVEVPNDIENRAKRLEKIYTASRYFNATTKLNSVGTWQAALHTIDSIIAIECIEDAKAIIVWVKSYLPS